MVDDLRAELQARVIWSEVMSDADKTPASASAIAGSKRLKSMLDRGIIVVVKGRPLRGGTPRVVITDEVDDFVRHQSPSITTRG